MATMVELHEYKTAEELAYDLNFKFVNIHVSEGKNNASVGVSLGLKNNGYFTVGNMSAWWTSISVSFTDYGAPYVVLVRNTEGEEYDSLVLDKEESNEDFRAVIDLAATHTYPQYAVRTRV